MIESHTDQARGLTTHTCTGKITAEALLSEIRAFYDAAPTPDNLWVFRDAEFRGFDREGVERFVNFIQAHAASRAGRKTAIVSAEDEAFGLGKLYKAFAELAEQRPEIQIFRSVEDAMVWLES